LVGRCIKEDALERISLEDLIEEVRDGRERCTDANSNGRTWRTQDDMGQFLPWSGVVLKTKEFDLSDPARPRQRTRRR
jgi:hypothetical protein